MEIIADNLHPKVLKNRLFVNAVDYLIDENVVEDQKGVSVRTGITEAALSNIRNDKKIVSDKTIRKFLDGFPGIFNPAYFKGDNIYMLVEDAVNAKMDAQKTVRTSEEESTAQLIEMYAQRVRLVDDLRTSLKNELDEVRALHTELQQARDDFREATYRLTQYVENKLASQQPYRSQIGMAAESDIISPTP